MAYTDGQHYVDLVMPLTFELLMFALQVMGNLGKPCVLGFQKLLLLELWTGIKQKDRRGSIMRLPIDGVINSAFASAAICVATKIRKSENRQCTR